MAITKIWCHKRQMERKSVSDVKKSVSDGIYYALNPEKTTLEGMKRIAEAEPDGIVAAVFNSLQKGVDYATDEEKTIKQKAELENCFSRDDECKFVTGINCSGNENAVDEFVITKQQWDNLEPEITHFHGVQSFKGYECTPETAHEIGVELARRLWGDRFQVVVCTHINKENVHNHFIVNATSFVDGKRFYDNNRTYYKMRYENDILCEKYGLSVVNTAKSKRTKGRSYYYHKMDKAGAPTRLNIAKEAIDIAVSKATSIEELADILYEMEFECDFSTNHKHWTLRSFSWDKCIRLTRLENAFGDDYSKLGIYNRIGVKREVNTEEIIDTDTPVDIGESMKAEEFVEELMESNTESHTSSGKSFAYFHKRTKTWWTDGYKLARKYLYGTTDSKPDVIKAYELMMTEALKGNGFAIHDVGKMFLFGLGCDEDEEQAQKWFTKAYEAFIKEESKTDTPAYLQYRIGKLYSFGYGVKQDYLKAAGWYEKAVAAKNPFAAYALGGLYLRGHGVAKNEKEAYRLYVMAANNQQKPNVYAQYELGKMCRDGIGTEVDLISSEAWFKRAYYGFEKIEATMADDRLYYRMGQMNYTGTGTNKNYEKSRAYYEKALELGNKDALYGLGKLYLNMEYERYDMEKGIFYLTKSAEFGNEYAERLLLLQRISGSQTLLNRRYGNTRYCATGNHLKRNRPYATGIYAYYLKWLYLLGVLPKKKRTYSARYAAYISHLVRDDVLNIQNILDESKLIAKHHIETGDELFSLKSDLQRQADELKQAAKKKNISPEERQKIQEEIRKKKREVKLCDYIWERSLIMAEKFETERRFKNESNYEYDEYHYDEHDALETNNNYDV